MHLEEIFSNAATWDKVKEQRLCKLQGFCAIVGVNSMMEGCVPVSMGPTLYKKKKL